LLKYSISLFLDWTKGTKLRDFYSAIQECNAKKPFLLNALMNSQLVNLTHHPTMYHLFFIPQTRQTHTWNQYFSHTTPFAKGLKYSF